RAWPRAGGDPADGVGRSLSALTHVPVLVSHCLCRIPLGATPVLFERFDTATLLDAIARHRITDVPLIGGMVFDVVAMGTLPFAARASVRKVSVGGGPTPMDAQHTLARILESAPLSEAHMQTQATA